MDELVIERRDEDGLVVVAAIGQVDVATASRLRQELTEVQYGGAQRVALDLDGVEFLDSFGLGVVVGALRRARVHGGALYVVCSRTRLLELFAVTGLDRILPVVPTIAAIPDVDQG